MALIPDLPAASGLSASDLFIIDTGSTTQKLPVSAAYASGSAPGFVSTGAQTFAGAKTFTAFPTIAQTTANSVAINFAFSDKNNQIYGQEVVAHTVSGGRFSFRQWAIDSGGNRTGAREDFNLPAPTLGRTENASYFVVTTKNIDTTIGLDKASFSGTKSITLPISYRGVLWIIDSNTSNCGEYIVSTTGAGVVITTAIKAASGITISTATNTLTLTISSGTRTIMMLSAAGTVTF